MSNIDELFEKIDENPIDNDLKLSIADTILAYLEDCKESLGAWEKAEFGQSISALATNVCAQQQPADSWLRLCLVALEKALIPKEERGEEYSNRDSQVETITYDILVGAVEDIKRQLKR